MQRLDAEHYREEAKKCREAAGEAEDQAAKEHWLEAERCWLALANQAELVTGFNRFQKEA